MEYSTDNDQLEVVDENDNVVALIKRGKIHRDRTYAQSCPHFCFQQGRKSLRAEKIHIQRQTPMSAGFICGRPR